MLCKPTQENDLRIWTKLADVLQGSSYSNCLEQGDQQVFMKSKVKRPTSSKTSDCFWTYKETWLYNEKNIATHALEPGVPNLFTISYHLGTVYCQHIPLLPEQLIWSNLSLFRRIIYIKISTSTTTKFNEIFVFVYLPPVGRCVA